ncbi:hypothetical protein N1851_011019 [Merluccius polli]|uniref:Uncharacterized protein n=1 Tax=Merluccius polli TaxID=89951 RepID=A0AA47P301_MERPO|nr:hypothetical protein N1851_011019 [Merluccius polli]
MTRGQSTALVTHFSIALNLPPILSVFESYPAWRWKVYDGQPHQRIALLQAMGEACGDTDQGSCQAWIRHSRYISRSSVNMLLTPVPWQTSLTPDFEPGPSLKACLISCSRKPDLPSTPKTRLISNPGKPTCLSAFSTTNTACPCLYFCLPVICPVNDLTSMDPAHDTPSMETSDPKTSTAMQRLELAEGGMHRMAGDISSLIQLGRQQQQQFHQHQQQIQQQQQQLAQDEDAQPMDDVGSLVSSEDEAVETDRSSVNMLLTPVPWQTSLTPDFEPGPSLKACLISCSRKPDLPSTPKTRLISNPVFCPVMTHQTLGAGDTHWGLDPVIKALKVGVRVGVGVGGTMRSLVKEVEMDGQEGPRLSTTGDTKGRGRGMNEDGAVAGGVVWVRVMRLRAMSLSTVRPIPSGGERSGNSGA